MKPGYVYKITSPSGKIYIGSTNNLNTRINFYKNLNCKRQPKLYNSLNKYGFENHTVEVKHYLSKMLTGARRNKTTLKYV